MADRDPVKQAEYVRKYQTQTCDQVTVRPPKGTKDRWRAAAERAGVSMQQYIIQAVEERMMRESEE